MKENKCVVFDARAIHRLQHKISHFKNCLRYVPKSIRSIKWDCNIFKREVCLIDSLLYMEEKLERITKIIDLAREENNYVVPNENE